MASASAAKSSAKSSCLSISEEASIPSSASASKPHRNQRNRGKHGSMAGTKSRSIGGEKLGNPLIRRRKAAGISSISSENENHQRKSKSSASMKNRHISAKEIFPVTPHQASISWRITKKSGSNQPRSYISASNIKSASTKRKSGGEIIGIKCPLCYGIANHQKKRNRNIISEKSARQKRQSETLGSYHHFSNPLWRKPKMEAMLKINRALRRKSKKITGGGNRRPTTCGNIPT